MLLEETLWYISKISKIYFVSVLPNVVVAVTCWHKRHRDLLQGMHSPLVAFYLTFRSSSLCLIVFLPTICLNGVFLRKAVTDVTLNTSPNISLIFNVIENEITFFDLVSDDVFFVPLFFRKWLNQAIWRPLNKHVLFLMLDCNEYSFIMREGCANFA